MFDDQKDDHRSVYDANDRTSCMLLKLKFAEIKKNFDVCQNFIINHIKQISWHDLKLNESKTVTDWEMLLLFNVQRTYRQIEKCRIGEFGVSHRIISWLYNNRDTVYKDFLLLISFSEFSSIKKWSAMRVLLRRIDVEK